MGGVLERIRLLQKRSAIALLPSPPVDPMILELQAAKRDSGRGVSGQSLRGGRDDPEPI